jgi:uncharacterized protein YegJ (DUF2314 family)
MKSVLLLILLTFTAVAFNQKPETLVTEGYSETEMNAAIARAKKETDNFLKELAKPTGEDHAVKAPIKDENGTEHFWLTDLTYKNGEFEGTINNDPGIVKNVKLGQKYKIKKEDISDWMYMKNGKMHGNYTMRPLLKTLPPDEAAKFKAMLAEP